MMSHRFPLIHLVAAALGLGILLLALLSPVTHANSDAALTLMASQAVVDHHTLKMDAFVNDPKNTFDFDVDYRVRKRGGSYYYATLGTPILSAPFVWIARRLGYDMLEPADDDAVQNAISALICAACFLLLYRLALYYAPPRDSLLIASILMLGSSLTSTLATALWNLGFAAIGMLLVAVELARHDTTGRPLRWPYIIVVTGIAFLCRPTVAFLGMGLAVYVAILIATAWRRRRAEGASLSPRLLVAMAVAAVLALVASRWLLEIEWLSNYYSPRRLWPPRTPLELGVYGSLLSPSRGLLIFSPFLFPVLVGILVRWRAIRREPLFWLAATWTLTHLVGVAIKGVWWGGFSYGPRMMAETMIPAALVTLLVYRHLDGPSAGRGTARALAISFLVLGLVAIPIHAYQGLFNLSTVRWNEVPNIDQHSEYVFSWRYPQFLASPEQIERRHAEIQEQNLVDYRPGETILPRSDRVIFDGWRPAETSWRWSSRPDPRLRFRLAELGADKSEYYVLEWKGGAIDALQAIVHLNDERLGDLKLEGFEPQTRRFIVPGSWLRNDGLNELRFDVPRTANVKAEAESEKDDGRALGLAMRSIKLDALDLDQRLVTFRDDPFFLSGWSRAEANLRWSDQPRARLLYPLPGATAARSTRNPAIFEARLSGRALGLQRVRIVVEGQEVGTFEFDGFEPVSHRFTVPPAAMEDRLVDLEFHLLDAARPAGDTRLLGLGFIALEIRPAEAGAS